MTSEIVRPHAPRVDPTRCTGATYPRAMTTDLDRATGRAYGAQSMTAPLLDVLVKTPGPAFAAAYDEVAHGFLRHVDLETARREHDGLVDTLTRLGTRVHVLDAETDDPDLVYVFDPLLIADGGAIPLRPGKPNRAGEPGVLEAWTRARGIPTLGRIEAPGTLEGGDTFWLRPDLLCVGRTLRTNDAGARQLASIVGGDVRCSTCRTGRARTSSSTCCR